MKLLELHIEGFGKFHNKTISFHDGMNVIYGKNEAGKSTLHTFIRGMLFGIERGRGRAAKSDLYSRFEPWENSGTYEGWLRLESGGTIYRLERRFRRDSKSFQVINETLGREEEPTKALMDRILGGLNETTYNNTISIGQLKSATEDGMVNELKNYIANLNTTGNISLNITKATAFLRNQKRSLESNLVPDASKEFTSLLTEIRNLEAEIASPEYENQLSSLQKTREQVRGVIESTRAEKDELDEKLQKSKALLSEHGFSEPPFRGSLQRAGGWPLSDLYAYHERMRKEVPEGSGSSAAPSCHWRLWSCCLPGSQWLSVRNAAANRLHDPPVCSLPVYGRSCRYLPGAFSPLPVEGQKLPAGNGGCQRKTRTNPETVSVRRCDFIRFHDCTP